jgi:hypothetical protein
MGKPLPLGGVTELVVVAPWWDETVVEAEHCNWHWQKTPVACVTPRRVSLGLEFVQVYQHGVVVVWPECPLLGMVYG